MKDKKKRRVDEIEKLNEAIMEAGGEGGAKKRSSLTLGRRKSPRGKNKKSRKEALKKTPKAGPKK